MQQFYLYLSNIIPYSLMCHSHNKLLSLQLTAVRCDFLGFAWNIVSIPTLKEIFERKHKAMKIKRK
jgi:hypothetical protein